MSPGSQTVPVPPRYSRVDPWVISSDTDAEIAFLESAFDAQETPGSRMLGPDGRIGHVEVELGDAVADGELGQRFADPSAQQAMAYVEQSLAREMKRHRRT
jgi:hypothetical protein